MIYSAHIELFLKQFLKVEYGWLIHENYDSFGLNKATNFKIQIL